MHDSTPFPTRAMKGWRNRPNVLAHCFVTAANMPGVVVVFVFNPRSWAAEAGDVCEFKATVANIVSFQPANAGR